MEFTFYLQKTCTIQKKALTLPPEMKLRTLVMEEENKIVIYRTEDNSVQLDVKLDGEMLWLNRQQLATLFGRDYKTISKHINNALKEELAGLVVVAKFANTTPHGAMINKTQSHDVEYLT